MTKIAMTCLAVSMLIVGAGCEADESRVAEATTTTADLQKTTETTTDSSSSSASTPAPAPAPAPSFTGDELDVSSAVSLGTHAGFRPQDARVTRAMYSADKQGDTVRLDFDALNWPKDGQLDGRVCMYWIDGGSVIGGHFDWHKAGQTVKTLENINGGYLGGKKPAKGSPIWFCIISIDGSERTNMKQSSTTW